MLSKNFLYLCFSKINCLPTTLSPPLTIEEDDQNLFSSSPPNHSADTNSSTALIKNFNTVYDLTSDSTSKSLISSTEDYFSSDDGSDSDSIPDLSTVFASERFFFSTPGSSNSIIEPPAEITPPESNGLVTGSVAVQTYSPDPYADFRGSMQEMVEARGLTDVKANWEMLHELLLCYLTLNPKHTHKIIVNAFADLVISLMSSSSTTTTIATPSQPT